MLCGFELYSRWVPLIVKNVYGKEPRYNETKPRYIANIFSQSLGPSLNRGSTVAHRRPQNLGSLFKLL